MMPIDIRTAVLLPLNSELETPIWPGYDMIHINLFAVLMSLL